MIDFRRMSVILSRLVKRMKKWKVMLDVSESQGGTVTVTPIDRALWPIGRTSVIEVLNDDVLVAGAEIVMIVMAVDVDHAIERAMPGLHQARVSYAQSKAR